MTVKVGKNMPKTIQFSQFQIMYQNLLRNISIARGGITIVQI